MRFRYSAFLVAGLMLVPMVVSAQSSDDPPPGEYRIVDRKVDWGTFLGWQVFHSTCHACHGVNATGTDVAPNLLESVKRLSPREFVAKVLTSYRLVPRAGTSSDDPLAGLIEQQIEQSMRRERNEQSTIKMPAWEEEIAVRPHVLDLYAYLSARSHGKLGPGKPDLDK